MDPSASGAAVERRALPPATHVLLLSVWLDAHSSWHARAVLTDARSFDFDSPFELAQFLAQAPRTLGRTSSGASGLR